MVTATSELLSSPQFLGHRTAEGAPRISAATVNTVGAALEQLGLASIAFSKRPIAYRSFLAAVSTITDQRRLGRALRAQDDLKKETWATEILDITFDT